RGLASADLQADGLNVTGNVAVTAPSPSLEATGGGLTINGNLSVLGTFGQTVATFDTATLTEVKGFVTVRGGPIADTFTTTGNFKADKNVTLTLGGGENIVGLGDGSGTAVVLGKVTVRTGNGNDN